jgi:glycosyl transferase, family 25
MNVIDFFDQVRIINMETRSDRKEEIVDEFNKYGFGINNDKTQFFKAITPASPDGFPNIGTRGCYMSHLNVLEEAQKANVRNILILEDDVQFTKHINTLGKTAVETLNLLDWDLVYIGHALKSHRDTPSWKTVDQPMMLAHCYAINGKTISKLIAFLRLVLTREPGHPDGGPMHYDGALNTFMAQYPEIKAYYYSANLAYQRPSVTNIHTTSLVDNNKFSKPIMALLRKIKARILSLIR